MHERGRAGKSLGGGVDAELAMVKRKRKSRAAPQTIIAWSGMLRPSFLLIIGLLGVVLGNLSILQRIEQVERVTRYPRHERVELVTGPEQQSVEGCRIPSRAPGGGDDLAEGAAEAVFDPFRLVGMRPGAKRRLGIAVEQRPKQLAG